MPPKKTTNLKKGKKNPAAKRQVADDRKYNEKGQLLKKDGTIDARSENMKGVNIHTNPKMEEKRAALARMHDEVLNPDKAHLPFNMHNPSNVNIPQDKLKADWQAGWNNPLMATAASGAGGGVEPTDDDEGKHADITPSSGTLLSPQTTDYSANPTQQLQRTGGGYALPTLLREPQLYALQQLDNIHGGSAVDTFNGSDGGSLRPFTRRRGGSLREELNVIYGGSVKDWLSHRVSSPDDETGSGSGIPDEFKERSGDNALVGDINSRLGDSKAHQYVRENVIKGKVGINASGNKNKHYYGKAYQRSRRKMGETPVNQMLEMMSHGELKTIRESKNEKYIQPGSKNYGDNVNLIKNTRRAFIRNINELQP